MAKTAAIQARPRQSSLPSEISVCRAIRFGGDDGLIYCLQAEAGRCGYALRFGSGYFCHHPKRLEIVARTKTRCFV
jgi:hypothetical protein